MRKLGRRRRWRHEELWVNSHAGKSWSGKGIRGLSYYWRVWGGHKSLGSWHRGHTAGHRHDITPGCGFVGESRPKLGAFQVKEWYKNCQMQYRLPGVCSNVINLPSLISNDHLTRTCSWTSPQHKWIQFLHFRSFEVETCHFETQDPMLRKSQDIPCSGGF